LVGVTVGVDVGVAVAVGVAVGDADTTTILPMTAGALVKKKAKVPGVVKVWVKLVPAARVAPNAPSSAGVAGRAAWLPPDRLSIGRKMRWGRPLRTVWVVPAPFSQVTGMPTVVVKVLGENPAWVIVIWPA
jgi:hypothetical protein